MIGQGETAGRAGRLLVVLGIVLLLTGCRKAVVDPTREQQARVAAMLADPALCSSGNSADVQAFVNAAGPDGVARIPAGCYRITQSIGVAAGKRVFGAGSDQTILYRDPELISNRDTPIFSVMGRSESLTQVSGLAFVGVRDTSDKAEDYGILLKNARTFRVDHCYFEGFGWAGVRTDGTSRGVVDHSIFVDNFKQGINNLGYGVVVYGTGQWSDDLGAGTEEAVFVEDNVFSGNRHAIAASGGAHYVFRHNRVLRNVLACSIDAHGVGWGWDVGTRYVEIYDNTIEDAVYRNCGIGIRGGDGVIFGNTVRGFAAPILLVLEWGTPESLKAIYPAEGQIRELYVWDNSTGSGAAMPRLDPEAKGFIQPGRDYFTRPKPGYEPYVYPHPLVGGGSLDEGAPTPRASDK
jgi:hypothetical protein